MMVAWHEMLGTRLCREVAMQNSPGLQPWVRWVVKGALKVARDVGHAAAITREQPKDASRPPLSGRFRATHNPGLKPWAVIYSRFAAKSDKPLWDGSYTHVSQAFHAWLPSFNPFGIIKHG